QDRGVAIDSRHLMTQPISSELQPPNPSNFPSIERSYVNTYRSNYLQTHHQYNDQDFKPATFPPLNYNRVPTFYKNLGSSNPHQSRNVKNDNFQYFNFRFNTTPVMARFKPMSLNNTRINLNLQQSSGFVPSIPYSYQLLPMYPKTDAVTPSNYYRNVSSTTEINFFANKQPGIIYKQQTTTIRNSYIPQNLNYYNIHTYIPSTDNYFKQAKQVHDTLVRSRNIKEPSLYSIQDNLQKSLVNITSKIQSFPNNNETMLQKIIKTPSRFSSLITQDKSKDNKTLNATLQIFQQAKPKSLNKTQLNTTHTDDVYYYYYYDDDNDNATSKDLASTVPVNKKQITSPQKFSDNYYDDYYDYKEPNNTDYYYEDSYFPTKNDSNNSTKHLSRYPEPSTQPTKSKLQPVTSSYFPPSTSKNSKLQKVTGELTTTSLPPTTHITTSQLMSTTRPTTANLRQRLTTHGHINHNFPSSHQQGVTT
ncbi:hypothetical protein ILUMI_22151, partial [Ignelater luminosus]